MRARPHTCTHTLAPCPTSCTNTHTDVFTDRSVAVSSSILTSFTCQKEFEMWGFYFPKASLTEGWEPKLLPINFKREQPLPKGLFLHVCLAPSAAAYAVHFSHRCPETQIKVISYRSWCIIEHPHNSKYFSQCATPSQHIHIVWPVSSRRVSCMRGAWGGQDGAACLCEKASPFPSSPDLIPTSCCVLTGPRAWVIVLGLIYVIIHGLFIIEADISNIF